MPNIQEIFNRINENRAEQKDLKRIYRDALDNTAKYKEVVEEIKKLTEKKKQVVTSVQNDFKPEFDRLDQLKADMEADQTLLSDMALTQLLKGESVNIIDKNDTSYEPLFSVKFIKAK